jgi:diguanylate cyclase (GGDEF)-like protein
MHVKKGGELVEVAITVSPLRDSSDNIVGTSTIVRDITERRIAEARIRELTLIDELTGLHNRRGFFTLAEPLLALNRRSRQGMLLLYADMDGFKHINDSLGHAEGDRALQDIAQILRTTFRDSDIISRIGGDEFAIIANEHMAETQAATVIRLQENLSHFNQTAARPYTLAMSVGTFYQDPVGTTSLDKILAIADAEMYRVKNQRRAKQKG